MFARFIQNTIGIPLSTQTNEQIKKAPTIHHAQRILELQMECEEPSASPDLISQLVQLYADAYQFYERQGSQKCEIYQKRMHSFLSKHSIESVLKGHKGHLVAIKQMVERKTQHAVYTSRDDAQRIIDKSLKKAEKDRKRIDRELGNQQKNLEARIQRRKSMSNKSTKSDNEDNNCDDLFGKKGLGFHGNWALDSLKERSGKRVFI